MQKSNSNSAVIWTIIILIVIVIVGIVIYYHSNSVNGTPASTAQQSSVGTVQSGAPMIPYYTLSATTTPTLGSYLVAANDMTLYTSSNDSTGISNCTGSCATTWPPYTVASTTPFSPGPGVDGQISSITRADGTTQVTYNGMPLYFYQGDSNPGDVNGNGMNGFSVVQP